MKRYFFIILIFSFNYSYSQFHVGKKLDESIKEIKTYRKDILINQEYYLEINSIVLKYTIMNSQIACYFRNNICYLVVIIPNKISAYNEWIKSFNDFLVKNGDNKWVKYVVGKAMKFEVEYWPTEDKNIIRIYYED